MLMSHSVEFSMHHMKEFMGLDCRVSRVHGMASRVLS